MTKQNQTKTGLKDYQSNSQFYLSEILKNDLKNCNLMNIINATVHFNMLAHEEHKRIPRIGAPKDWGQNEIVVK